MFGQLLNNYRLSEAAVIVQNLLEMHGRGGAVGRDAGTIANKLVSAVCGSDPELYEGKRGKRPHKYSVAAAALARGVKVMAGHRNEQLCFHLSLGTILLELTGKAHMYALSGNDHALLELAQAVYLASASPVPNREDEPTMSSAPQAGRFRAQSREADDAVLRDRNNDLKSRISAALGSRR